MSRVDHALFPRGFRLTCERVMVNKRVVAWAKPLEEEQALEEEWDNVLGNADLADMP